MRISDWSSDVCSSDLRCRSAITTIARQADPGRPEQQFGNADILSAVDRRLAQDGDRSWHLIDQRQGSRGGDDDHIRLRSGCRIRRGRRLRKILRSEEHTSELQSLMRISYAVFCLKKKNNNNTAQQCNTTT